MREEDGYIPVNLERAPLAALEGIPVYLRSVKRGAQGRERAIFTLYCAEHVRFTLRRRQRLLARDVRFVYIPAQNFEQFKTQRSQTKVQTQQVEDASVPPRPAKVAARRKP